MCATTDEIETQTIRSDQGKINPQNTAEPCKPLTIAFWFVITYLALKLILFPVGLTAFNIWQTTQSINSPEKVAIQLPDISFADITLILIILLFQPQVAKVFESLNVSPQGVQAKFRELKEEVDKNKKEIDQLQQEQIDLIQAQQKEFDKLQKFMYNLLLKPKEVEKLKELKEKSEQESEYKFYMTQIAADELRRLRDSQLIKVKPPYHYIGEIEDASNHGTTEKDFVDLTQYLEITPLGEEFLQKKEAFSKAEATD